MADVIGEVIGWNLRGLRIPYDKLVSALVGAGLDAKVARVMLPRNAFLRACRAFKANRVITMIDDNPEIMVFQFTREHIDKEIARADFEFEAKLTLDKLTRHVRCAVKELETLANKLLDAEFGTRSTSDVTRLIIALFKKNGLGRYSIFDRGGAYFIPAEHLSFADKIDHFLAKFGQKLKRMAIAGTASSMDAVEDAVARDVEKAISEHIKAIDKLDGKSRESSWERVGEDMEATRFRIELMSKFLRDKTRALEKGLREAKDKLRAKLGEPILVEAGT